MKKCDKCGREAEFGFGFDCPGSGASGAVFMCCECTSKVVDAPAKRTIQDLIDDMAGRTFAEHADEIGGVL